jgi:hypothetical protein
VSGKRQSERTRLRHQLQERIARDESPARQTAAEEGAARREVFASPDMQTRRRRASSPAPAAAERDPRQLQLPEL